MTAAPPSAAAASRPGLWLAAILAAVFLAYAPSLGNGFTYDDQHYVAAYTLRGPNPMVVGEHPVSEYFKRPMGYGVQEKSRGFRPVTVLSYAWTHHAVRTRLDPPRRHPDFIERPILQEWTDPAWPHHLINIGLHLLATFLVYVLLRRLTGPGVGALAATAVFGLHALRSDQVIAIVGRGELFAFVFGLLGAWWYLAACDAAVARRWWRLPAAFAALFLAFLSKESAVGWAVMALLLATFVLVRDGVGLTAALRRQVGPWCGCVLVPVLLYFYLRAGMLAGAEAAAGFRVTTDSNPLFHLGLLERLPTAVMVWGYGLYKLFQPYPLACDYSRAVFEVVGYGSPWFLLAAVALLGVLVGGLWAVRRQPLLFLAAAVFLGFGFITSNIPVPIETIFGERLYYTPGLGLALLVAACPVRGHRLLVTVVAGCCLVSAVVCVQRAFEWRSNDTLFEVDADRQPRSLALQMNMARVCRLREDWFGRDRYLDRALAIDPEYASALNDRAADLMNEGRHSEALPLLQRAVRSVARDPVDREVFGPDTLVNLAFAHHALGQHPAAQRTYRRVIEVCDPRFRRQAHHDALLGLALLAWRAGDTAAVERQLQESERLFPDDHETRIYRAALAGRAGDAAAAIGILRPLLSRIPQSDHTVVGYEALIAALRASGEVDAAAAESVRLGAVLLGMGKPGPARRAFQQALDRPRYRLPAYRGLAWAGWELGGAREVEEVLVQAAPLAPEDPEFAVHRALVAFANGDAATAVAVLSGVLPRLPPSRSLLRAWYDLARAFAATGDLANAGNLVGRFVRERGLPSAYKRKFVQLQNELATVGTK